MTLEIKALSKAKFVKYAYKNKLVYCGAYHGLSLPNVQGLIKTLNYSSLQTIIDDADNIRVLQNKTLSSLCFEKTPIISQSAFSYLSIAGTGNVCYEISFQGAHFLIVHETFNDSLNSVIYHVGITNLLN